jgi:ribosome biogenesis GTPase
LNLHTLGWSSFFAEDYEQRFSGEYQVARVIGQGKNIYKLATNNGELYGRLSGKYQFHLKNQSELPVVGDWIVFKQGNPDSHAAIHGILRRKSCFSRKVPGSNMEEQVIAANIDFAFLVMALNNDFNLR